MGTAYINEVEWKQALSQIPVALHEKRICEIEQHGENLGVMVQQSGPGWLVFRLKNLRAPRDFFTWLEFCSIAAVELDPEDIPHLMGKNLDSLVLKRGLEKQEVTLGLLEPHQIMDTLRNLSHTLQASSSFGAAPIDESSLHYAEIEDDLVNAGLMPRPYRVPAGFDEFSNQPLHGYHQDVRLPKEFLPDPPDPLNPFN